VKSDDRPNLTTTSYAVFTDPTFEQLRCRKHAVLLLRELSDCGRHLAIPHDSTETRTASNFLPAGPEI
jgi:hypothetical protein